MIYFLVVEQRYEAAFQPLFDRYVKGQNGRDLYRNDHDGFGLFREVVDDLEAIGLELR